MEKVQAPNKLTLAALAVAGLVLERTGMKPEQPLKLPAPAANNGDQAGADAETPGEIPPRGWWHVAKRAAAGFSDDRVMATAAGVTFYAMLAIFPAIASLISLYGLLADPSKLYEQLQGLGGVVPGGGIQIISDQVKSLTSSGQKALGFGFLVGLATSLWSANAGVKAFFDALNVVYHERERRSFLRLTMISFCFTLALIALIILALFAVVVIPVVLNYIGLGSETAVLLSIARWPVMLVAVALALSFMYRYGPSRREARWQWVSLGSAFGALGWIIVSLAFSYYVENFGSYNKTYGSLGAAMGFMTWIWVSVMVVLMGAELNAELEQQTGRDSTVGGKKPLGSSP
jgi:membrane protein